MWKQACMGTFVAWHQQEEQHVEACLHGHRCFWLSLFVSGCLVGFSQQHLDPVVMFGQGLCASSATTLFSRGPNPETDCSKEAALDLTAHQMVLRQPTLVSFLRCCHVLVCDCCLAGRRQIVILWS